MYTVIDLGRGVAPTDIDAHDNVLATTATGGSSVLIRPTGEVVDIAAKVGVPVGIAYGMNDFGRIVAGGGYVCDLVAGVATPVPLTLPLAITNAGFVVGRDHGRPACVDMSTGARTFLFGDESGGSALAVNESGMMCGVGFLGTWTAQVAWSRRLGEPLRVHAIGSPSIATAIDASGRIVGVDDGVGFVIDPVLGRIDVTPPAGGHTSVLDIADTGRHVGLMVTASAERRGFVGHRGVTMDLTAMLVAGPDVVVDTAIAINAAGSIAATGWIRGEYHGLRLMPITPSTSRFRTLAALLHILQGGRLDDAGVGIGPGGVPEPIPRGPLRDGMVGLAIAELAELLDDRGTRAGVRALALERVEVALEASLGTARAMLANTGHACDLGPGFPPLHEL